MHRKLPALALVLAFALAACGNVEPLGPDAPAADRVVVPGVFLDNGGMFGNGNRDGSIEAAADDAGYAGKGGRDAGEVTTLDNGGMFGNGN
jgi:hypothetical protein